MSQHQVTQATQQVPAGWYPDQTGHLRWWDGFNWGVYAPIQQPPVQQVQVQHPRYANRMPVSYVRPQRPHSLTKWIIASLFMVGIPWLIYYSISPNHYWEA
ncbi:DUF2510 domain-containing protein [Leucobacter sp. Z1108]|uniref:DUF2510 domain-containing protein n=1 Tax=Leucobacter sp. Z1108 TaxID=3439066 RepID=UPI003F2D9267